MITSDGDDTACLACGGTIRPGDRYFPDVSGVLCADCAPTYQELIDAPDGFVDASETPRTAEECRAEFDAHIAAGGVPSDTMATRTWE